MSEWRLGFMVHHENAFRVFMEMIDCSKILDEQKYNDT